jgi:hypothetical protein
MKDMKAHADIQISGNMEIVEAVETPASDCRMSVARRLGRCADESAP